MDSAGFRTCTWSGRWNGISTKWEVDKKWRRQKIDHFWQPKKNPLPQLPLFNRFLLKLRLRVKTRKTQEIARKRKKTRKMQENAWKVRKHEKTHEKCMKTRENAWKCMKTYENAQKRKKKRCYVHQKGIKITNYFTKNALPSVFADWDCPAF